MGWDGEGREKNKPSERGAMKWRADKARSLAIATTCVCCLEDDNECMVYMSYIVAWARPLQIVSYLQQPCPRSYAKWWINLAANLRLILSETSHLYQQEDNTPHTQTQNPQP